MEQTALEKRPADPERGSSLIEVLVALMIMLFLMIGVLQLFSMAYLVNLGSGARTEMTYKCQQAAENIRLLNYLQRGGFTVPAGTGMTLPITAATTAPAYLPYTSSELASAPYWGSGQSNVVEGPNMPYKLYYQIADGGAFWVVTCSAIPTDAAGSGRRYKGTGIGHKRIDYVSQIAK